MKKFLVGSAASAAGIGIAGAGAAAYVNRMVQGRATGDLEGFLGRNSSDPVSPVIFIGDSIVRGRASVDFVDKLRPEFPHLELVNGGVNGDMAYDARERLVNVISGDPVGVVVLIGTNDVRATLGDAQSNEVARRTQHHPEPPSLGFFSANLRGILEDLKTATHAAIAVCSLPPLGEDLDSDANRRINEYNVVIADLAQFVGVTYLGLHEALSSWLREHQTEAGRDYPGTWRVSASSLTQRFLVGRSFDQIAERNGFQLTPDGMHLNTEGAQLAADVIGTFLGSITPDTASAPEE